MVKVYLASRYSRRAELNGYADQLRARGHECTSRWLQGDDQRHGAEAAQAVETARFGSVPVESGALFAEDDIADIRAADIFVVFTSPTQPGDTSKPSRGGFQVEMGVALGSYRLGLMPIILVGPRVNIFYCLPEVRQATSWEEALRMIEVVVRRGIS